VSCIFDKAGAGVTLVQNHEVQTSPFDQASHPARRCADCGHVFFDPPPPDLLDRYYSEDYPAASVGWYNVAADYANEKTTPRANRIVSIATDFGFARPETKNTELYHEIGCAFGGTVEALNRRGYLTTGTELNAGAVAQGRARGNAAIFAEPDADFLRRVDRQPNVVFGHHVFEHMPDPVGYLRNLAPCLATDSIVILFVPNAMALFPAAYGFMRYPWFAFPGHLNLFSAGSALCLAQAAGYELLDVASRMTRLEPAATDQALNSRIKTPVMARIRDHLVEAGLMAEELALVLTPAASPTAARHAAKVTATAGRCQANKRVEAAIRDLGETAVLGDPFAPRPNFAELLKQSQSTLEQCQSLLEQRDAELATALGQVKQADLLRNAIETSTFWRATRGVRLLADWLKSRGLWHRVVADAARSAGD
jgi:SAM-dependent methyltransferase